MTGRQMRAAIGALMVLGGCGDQSGGDTSGGVGSTGAGSTGAGSTGAGSTGGAAPTTGVDEGTGTTGPASLPGPWDQGVYIPPEPQAPGDPVKGYEALVTKGYITCGIPWLLFGLAKPALGSYADGEALPGRSGKNAEVPFNWTVHTVDGADIVS